MSTFMGHHVEVQNQCKSSLRHRAAIQQGYKCSSDEWQHNRMVQINIWNRHCRPGLKEKEEEIDRRRNEKTILKNEQEWTLQLQLGQLKAE